MQSQTWTFLPFCVHRVLQRLRHFYKIDQMLSQYSDRSAVVRQPSSMLHGEWFDHGRACRASAVIKSSTLD